MIFNYDNLMVDKENNELIGDNEFREEDYNNWNEINFANIWINNKF